MCVCIYICIQIYFPEFEKKLYYIPESLCPDWYVIQKIVHIHYILVKLHPESHIRHYKILQISHI